MTKDNKICFFLPTHVEGCDVNLQLAGMFIAKVCRCHSLIEGHFNEPGDLEVQEYYSRDDISFIKYQEGWLKLCNPFACVPAAHAHAILYFFR